MRKGWKSGSDVSGRRVLEDRCSCLHGDRGAKLQPRIFARIQVNQALRQSSAGSISRNEAAETDPVAGWVNMEVFETERRLANDCTTEGAVPYCIWCEEGEQA